MNALAEKLAQMQGPPPPSYALVRKSGKRRDGLEQWEAEALLRALPTAELPAVVFSPKGEVHAVRELPAPDPYNGR